MQNFTRIFNYNSIDARRLSCTRNTMFANFEVTPSFLFTVLLACNNLQPSKTQAGCSIYPCYNGGTCMPRPPGMCICPSGVVQPFCKLSCQNIQVPCVNGGCFGEVCSCPTNFAGPTCESAIFAYLSPLEITVTEGHVGQKAVTVQVCRQPSSEEVTLAVYTLTGSGSAAALPGVDFVNIPLDTRQDVTISAGLPCAPVNVFILSELTQETMSKDFLLVLYDPSPSSSSMVHIVPDHRFTTITIIDDDPDMEPPTIHNCPNDITVTAPVAEGSTTVTWTPPTATDLSGAVTPTSPQNPGESFIIGSTQVTYTANDGANNLAFCRFTVTVVDFDECTISLFSTMCDSSTSTCMNTMGSYMCVCMSGYTGSPYTPPGQQSTCTDQDECTTSTNVCETSSSTCLNTMGSYICMCRSGYTGSTFTPGLPSTCTDQNECSSAFSNLCDRSSSTCFNTMGSYRCVCKSGYTGSPYTPPGQRTCTDNTPPIISDCPSSTVVRAISQDDDSVLISWTEPTATDISVPVTVVSSHRPGQQFSIGSATVTYTFTDTAGNSDMCSFQVFVFEIILQCPGTITAMAGSEVSFNNPTCLSVTFTPETSSSSCVPAGGSTISADTQVSCSCNNFQNVQCSFEVFVTGLPITIQCPNPTTIMFGSSVEYTTPSCNRNGNLGSSVTCLPSSGTTPTNDIDVTCTCDSYQAYRCSFHVTVTGAPATIQCPDDLTVQVNSQLMYSNPACISKVGSSTSQSSCSPVIGSRITSDVEVTCTCNSYQNVQCSFMVTVEAYVDCPELMVLYAGDQLSFTNPSCMFMGASSPSTCDPQSGFRVLSKSQQVTCTCDNYPDTQCSFQIFTQMDCALTNSPPCNENCYCEEATSCTNQPSVCSSECRIFGCPVNITSESLSQVNPQSSVQIKCILEGSSSVLNSLEIRLSRSEEGLDEVGINQVNAVEIPSNRRESTYRVMNVSQDDQFFCVIFRALGAIGAVSVTEFVYRLPSISDLPTEVTRTTTSVTITWRPWNEETDVGDPPVVAYIPYYRMDPSQDWMSGSRIQSDQTLEYAATSLESDRNYTFSVAAVRAGEGGEGPRGPPVTIKTLCIDVVPQMVTTTLTATNDVTVTWQQPTVQCSTGITQFTIYYEIEGDVSSRQQAGTADPNAETFTVDGSLLEPGTTYNIAVTVTTDQESALSEGLSVTATKPTGSPGSLVAIIIGVVIVVLIVLILLLLIFIVVRKRKMEDQPDPVYDQPLNDIGKQSGPSGSTDHSSGAVNMALNVTEVKKTKESAVASSSVPDEGGIYGNLEPPSPIKIADFPEYIVNNINKVEHEFGLLEGVQQKHPWTVAEEEFNRKKNRFRNMYPYDHCRVVLPKLPGDHSSDYYNASFILNARDERAYIASQAPNKASVDDFWRLIWEQNVQTIVMLANLYEATKERCLQYWPKEESETQSFGYIDVTWTKTQHFADYEIRTFSVKRDGTTRDIEQLHFTEWPDKDIPDNGMCLVEFARHCKLIHFNKQTPYLIHCSAGIGRTGTFIGLLSMMDVLQSEEYIDIFAFVNKMRENRVNMIQTKQQYRYLHTCLYEFHLTRDCQIPARSLSRFKIKENKAAILREFQLLSEMEKSMTTDSHETGRTTDTSGRGSSSDSHETDWSMAREHAPRDRFGNMVPLERRKVFLISSSPSNPDNYINASFVKSYEKKDAFITTQSPLPNTIEDFWRMIYDHKCRTVVMLNQLDGEDKTCVQYWPNRGSLQYGIMTVTCIATEQHSDYVKRTFDVTLNNSANVISVTHLQLEDWPPKGSPQSLIRLITDAHKLQEEANVEKPLVVHCINGFGRSGVFVTVQSEIERIRATGLVNIFATVKKLRNEHQHMMKKKMEYKLCFDFLIEFSKRYDNYENW
ncbi:uncharacterized protein [Apostichopus japonicus]|uniref:uncharacterized protein n=1 Tax=Stichopus japonicus TaxID=307972 RepID=UPI003AB6F8A2